MSGDNNVEVKMELSMLAGVAPLANIVFKKKV